jgi:putative phosphoribosyl transferase
VFKDREDAGERLGEALEEYRRFRPLVLAIPRGGIPVGSRVADYLGADFDVVVARKVPIPWEPEAGLGAVGPDGELALNEDIVRHLRLSEDELTALSERVLQDVRRREEVLRGGRPHPAIRDRSIILVDDGLATGYTMVAAARWVRKGGPERVIIAVPCSSGAALESVRPLADTVVALEVSHAPFFAVADFYERWRDLRDEDVLPYLPWSDEKGYYRRR